MAGVALGQTSSGGGSSGGLTDAELRATPVTVTAGAGSVAHVNNGAGVDSVNIQDGGNSITVDGVVSASPDSVTTGSITAAAQSVTAAIADGAQGVGLAFFGTYATGATLTWEVSADGGTTYTTFGMLQTVTLLSWVQQIAAGANQQGFFQGNLPPAATHVRVRCATWAAPTGAINIRLAQTAAPRAQTPGNPFVTISAGAITTVTTGTTAASLCKAEDVAAASGDAGVFALGVRNDTQSSPVNADGDYIQQSHDARGAQRVNTASFAYAHISTAATTTVKSGAGDLHSISVNTKGTVASTITVFDSTTGSGTVIGVIDSLNLSGAFVLDVAFATGRTIVTTGTVAPDLTVSFR